MVIFCSADHNSRVNVFVTGGTGYIGSHLIPALIARGHNVKAVVREGSEKKLPPSVLGVTSDPLKMDSYTGAIPPADTFVPLEDGAYRALQSKGFARYPFDLTRARALFAEAA